MVLTIHDHHHKASFPTPLGYVDVWLSGKIDPNHELNSECVLQILHSIHSAFSRSLTYTDPVLTVDVATLAFVEWNIYNLLPKNLPGYLCWAELFQSHMK